MINLSLSTGHFPDSWKLAKVGLEPVRQVRNLQYTSKLVETVFAKQLHKQLSSNNLLTVYQSAYRHHHSTETALLKVVNDILLNMDKQRMTLLLLLDLSAAFDTVDYDTLLRRLKTPLLSKAARSFHGSNLTCLVVLSAFRSTVHSQEDSIWIVVFLSRSPFIHTLHQ